MSFLKTFLVKFILKRKVITMLDALKGKLEGKKTYVTVGVGLLVAAVGVLFGPVDLPGPVDIPAVTPQDFFKLLWEGLLATFIRVGVAAK